MTMLEEINAKYITAMKEKDTETKAILSIVKNKIMLASIDKRANNEELTDAEIVGIVQKCVKEVEEEIIGFQNAGRSEQVAVLEKQKSALTGFLPKMMSEEEIKNIILSLEDKSIGSVMKHFSQNYAGKCDMGLVSKITRALN